MKSQFLFPATITLALGVSTSSCGLVLPAGAGINAGSANNMICKSPDNIGKATLETNVNFKVLCVRMNDFTLDDPKKYEEDFWGPTFEIYAQDSVDTIYLGFGKQSLIKANEFDTEKTVKDFIARSGSDPQSQIFTPAMASLELLDKKIVPDIRIRLSGENNDDVNSTDGVEDQDRPIFYFKGSSKLEKEAKKAGDIVKYSFDFTISTPKEKDKFSFKGTVEAPWKAP